MDFDKGEGKVVLKQLEQTYESNSSCLVYHEWGPKTTYAYCVPAMTQTNLLSYRIRKIKREGQTGKPSLNIDCSESSGSLVHHFLLT